MRELLTGRKRQPFCGMEALCGLLFIRWEGRKVKEFLQVGEIINTHGLAGEVKVFPTTDDPKRFKKLKEVILTLRGKEQTLEISQVKFFKNLVILKFKGLDRIEDVLGLKGGQLFVPRSKAVPLQKDEYFIADLIGMEVCLDSGEAFGTLDEVIQTGTNDVYQVRTEKYGEVLIPAIHDCICSVDVENGRMTVHLLDGMLD